MDCTPTCLSAFIIYFKPKYCRKWIAILEQGIWQHGIYIVVKILIASCGVVVKRHSPSPPGVVTSCECNPNTLNDETSSESTMPTEANSASNLHGHHWTHTFSSTHPPRSTLRPTDPTLRWVRGLFPGLKQPACAVDHPPNIAPSFRPSEAVPIIPSRYRQGML